MGCNQLPRRLVLITGERHHCFNYCLAVPELMQGVWVSEVPPTKTDSVSPGHARRLLGTDQDAVILDALDDLHPDALGIVAGCVIGGGVLVILLPTVDVGNRAFSKSPFTARCIRLLLQCKDVEVVPAISDPECFPGPDRARIPADEPIVDGYAINAEQATAIDAVMHAANGQRRKPAILLADRGRGKSAALGIAAGLLLRQKNYRILVSGRSRKSAAQVFEHAQHVAPTHSPQPEWAPVESLLESPQESDLLLLDEAAGIPLALLVRLLEHYSRIAMATTVHGYEGSGRGFLLRFREYLDRHTRGLRICSLVYPVRWVREDPLEECINRVLMLNAEIPTNAETGGKIRFESVNRLQLASNDEELEEVFSLLVAGHYRTRPSDLKQLLDDSGMRIYRLLLETGDRAITAGVVLAALETCPTPELGKEILLGHRRPPAHVLAELLAGKAGIKAAISLHMLRIRRIVVHPAKQRKGLGSRMLREIGEHLADRVSLIGTQFALSPGLVRFWRSTDYMPVHLGTRKSRFAGEVSGLFLHALDSSGEAVQSYALARFSRHFPQALPRYYRSLQTDIVHELLTGLPNLAAFPEQDVLEEVADYSFGRVGESSVIASLTRCALWALCQCDPWKSKPEYSRLIIERTLQGRTWRYCAALTGDQGHRVGDSQLRDAFRSLIWSASPSLAQSYQQRFSRCSNQGKV